MTFTRLVLHNFGAYRGQHSCELSTTRSRPVVLIGGMNGAGKSTIMDAIQLALFGKLARCTGRRDVSYEEFLRRAINRDAQPQEARIQLEFVSHSAGQRTLFCLDRSWLWSEGRVREHFEVRRNGSPDRLLSESWLEHIDQWFPPSLSQIFFFDGEQLEALADAATSAAVLRAAVEGLLGLDLISRLTSDLTVLERRKDAAILPPAVVEELGRLEKRKAALEETRGKVRLELGAAQNALGECRRDLNVLDAKVAQEGGGLFDRKGDLEVEDGLLRARLASISLELREIAEGAAPLLLVRSLLESVLVQATLEERARNSVAATSVLEEHDRVVLLQLKNAGVGSAAVTTIAELMRIDRDQRVALSAVSGYLHVGSDTRDQLAGLKHEGLGRTQDQVDALIGQWKELSADIERSERQLAAIPSPEAIAHLLTSRDERRIALRAAESRANTLAEEVKGLDGEVSQLELAITRCRKASREQSRDSEDAERIVEHIGRVKETLSRFRSALLRRHARRIELLALDSLGQLLRKERLVTDLRIDPDSFAVTLTGQGGGDLPIERLSAGERQLLATSLLWGLRRAAGRIVPLVIDTPLGRLDSSHRRHLATNYFPFASHQTILLSTDQEIVGPYYKALKPWIGAEHTLTTDEEARSTMITPGYFVPPQDPAHVA